MVQRTNNHLTANPERKKKNFAAGRVGGCNYTGERYKCPGPGRCASAWHCQQTGAPAGQVARQTWPTLEVSENFVTARNGNQITPFVSKVGSKWLQNTWMYVRLRRWKPKQGLPHRGFWGGGNQALIEFYLTSVFKIICFWSSKHFHNIYLWYALNISLKNAEDIFPIWELSTGGLYYTIFSFMCLLLTNIREICQTLQFKLSSYLKVYISFKVYFQHEKS